MAVKLAYAIAAAWGFRRSHSVFSGAGYLAEHNRTQQSAPRPRIGVISRIFQQTTEYRKNIVIADVHSN
jgi:hypothetical protein